MTTDHLLRLARALQRAGVDYAVIGATALNLHGVVRATEDIDLMLAPTLDNVERLKRALREVWDDPAIDQIDADDLTGEYPVVRYGPPDEDVYLDLITHFGTAVRYADVEQQSVQIGDVTVRVATPLALARMKHGTVRPIDAADVQALLARYPKLRDAL